MDKSSNWLRNRRVLVLEDDYWIASDLVSSLRKSGADVVGPVSSVQRALQLVDSEKIDFALLDINLNGSINYEVPARLEDAGIPFVFSTGYDTDSIPSHFRRVPTLVKPFDLAGIVFPFSPDREAWPSPQWRPINKLLTRFPESLLQSLKPHMSLVPMKRHDVLTRCGAAQERIFFPETGVCSLLLGPMKSPVEVALVGAEGAVGFAEAEPGCRSAFHTLVQIPGFAVAIAAGPVEAAISENFSLIDLRSRYQQAIMSQTAYSAAANATQTVEQRLARWLLMCADRAGEELNIVHEHISLMLHVRRAGVTTAMHALESHKAIHSRRGSVTITDREALNRIAGWPYAEGKAIYDRLLAAPAADETRNGQENAAADGALARPEQQAAVNPGANRHYN